MASKHRVSLAAMALAALAAHGCNQATEESEAKSFLGFQASQNAAVRDGKAPTFIALGDWFQKFSVAAPPTSSRRFASTTTRS